MRRYPLKKSSIQHRRKSKYKGSRVRMVLVKRENTHTKKREKQSSMVETNTVKGSKVHGEVG